jgi:hypothetical protein
MRYITLTEFMERAVPYETSWPAPLDPRLRRGLLWSTIGSAASVVLLWILSEPFQWTHSEFFVVLGPQLHGLLGNIYEIRELLIALNMACLVIFGVIYLATDELKEGPPLWHWLAFGVVVIGVFDALVVGIAATIIAVNLAFWIAIAAAAAAIALIWLIGLALGAGNRR